MQFQSRENEIGQACVPNVSLACPLNLPKLHLLQLQNSRNRASAALSFLSPSIRLIVRDTTGVKDQLPKTKPEPLVAFPHFSA